MCTIEFRKPNCVFCFFYVTSGKCLLIGDIGKIKLPLVQTMSNKGMPRQQLLKVQTLPKKQENTNEESQKENVSPSITR